MDGFFENREWFAAAAGILLAAAALGCVSALRSRGKEPASRERLGVALLTGLGWVLLSFALFVRGSESGRLPVANPFEIFQTLGWFAVFFAAVLRFVWSLRVPAFFAAGIFIVTVGAALTSAAVALFPENVREIFEEKQMLVDALTSAENPLAAALCVPAIVVFTPILEEIVFRAGLYRFLKSKMTAVPAAALSSAVFALMHDAPASYLPLALLGCVFCLAYEKTGRLAAPVLIHALFNANSLVGIAFLAP